MRPALIVVAATWAAVGILSSCTSADSNVVGEPFDAGMERVPDAAVDVTTDALGDASIDARADADAGADADADAGPAYSCTVDGSADDDPVCDQCVRAHCCEWIVKCDASASCAATRACIAACPPEDFVCITSCNSTAGAGGVFLQELGACANNKCNAECTSDGGL